MKIALLGCGFIGSMIANAVKNKDLNMEITAAFDSDPKKCISLGFTPCSFNDFLSADFDLAVECASQEAVSTYAKPILSSGRSLILMSIGALSDKDLLSTLTSSATSSGAKIYLPSGAIGGLDAISSASFAGLDEVSLVTRKPPSSLGIDVSKETTVFNGTALEAVRKFPMNINIAAAISLAGIGFERTKVKIIADPKISMNTHEFHAKGKFGSFSFSFQNLPSTNPRTSLLAAFSAVSLLKRLSSPLQF